MQIIFYRTGYLNGDSVAIKNVSKVQMIEK